MLALLFLAPRNLLPRLPSLVPVLSSGMLGTLFPSLPSLCTINTACFLPHPPRFTANDRTDDFRFGGNSDVQPCRYFLYFLTRYTALAAISYTFPVTFAVNCITMGIGVGLSTCIGRLLGQGDGRQAARVSSHGLLLALLLVAAASTLGLLTIEPLFLLLGASHELIPLIKEYMVVWYLTIPCSCYLWPVTARFAPLAIPKHPPKL